MLVKYSTECVKLIFNESRLNGIKSYREYFRNLIPKVKYLDFPKLTECKIINIISKHFMEATNLLGKEDAHINTNNSTDEEPRPNNAFY